MLFLVAESSLMMWNVCKPLRDVSKCPLCLLFHTVAESQRHWLFQRIKRHGRGVRNRTKSRKKPKSKRKSSSPKRRKHGKRSKTYLRQNQSLELHLSPIYEEDEEESSSEDENEDQQMYSDETTTTDSPVSPSSVSHGWEDEDVSPVEASESEDTRSDQDTDHNDSTDEEHDSKWAV